MFFSCIHGWLLGQCDVENPKAFSMSKPQALATQEDSTWKFTKDFDVSSEMIKHIMPCQNKFDFIICIYLYHVKSSEMSSPITTSIYI